MPSRQRLLELAITASAADDVAQHVAPFRRRSRALELFAVLSISPHGFSDDLLGSALFPTSSPERQKQNLQMAAYSLRHTLGRKTTIRYYRGAYVLAPDVEGFEHLRSALQERFVWLVLRADGLIEPPLRDVVIQILRGGDAAAAAHFVVDAIPLDGPTTPPTAA